MSGGDKKKWSTPKLRVFVRTRADERVLGTCKRKTTVGPNSEPNSNCWQAACQGIGQS
jgi:hypothetical protein